MSDSISPGTSCMRTRWQTRAAAVSGNGGSAGGEGELRPRAEPSVGWNGRGDLHLVAAFEREDFGEASQDAKRARVVGALTLEGAGALQHDFGARRVYGEANAAEQAPQ